MHSGKSQQTILPDSSMRSETLLSYKSTTCDSRERRGVRRGILISPCVRGLSAESNLRAVIDVCYSAPTSYGIENA